MITIEKSQNGKKILAQKGDVVKVLLPENPTTGYLWKINSIDDKHLSYSEEEYKISGGAVGAGGMKTFYLKVINKGKSELHFALGRPWEKDTTDTFNVTIES
jgi:inhibitor of cysteine peptidase